MFLAGCAQDQRIYLVCKPLPATELTGLAPGSDVSITYDPATYKVRYGDVQDWMGSPWVAIQSWGGHVITWGANPRWGDGYDASNTEIQWRFDTVSGGLVSRSASCLDSECSDWVAEELVKYQCEKITPVVEWP